MKAYDQAWNMSKKDLKPTNTIRLGLKKWDFFGKSRIFRNSIEFFGLLL